MEFTKFFFNAVNKTPIQIATEMHCNKEHIDCNIRVEIDTDEGIAHVMVEHIVAWSNGKFVCVGFLAERYKNKDAEQDVLFYDLDEKALYIF